MALNDTYGRHDTYGTYGSDDTYDKPDRYDSYGTCDIRDPRDHPVAAGLFAQLALLAVLGTTVGLGPAGWLTGVAYGCVACAVLTRALRRSGARSFGPANGVTLARATLVGAVTALVADAVVGRLPVAVPVAGRVPVADPVAGPPVAVLVALAAVALILDAVDGRVARRTGSATALGARFDMEVDAFLILVLSAYVAASLGAWVLVIGAMRYAFVAAARALPWLRGPLPPSTARKSVAALQGIVLTVAAADVLPYAMTFAAVLLALASLAWSFGRDVRGLWRVRRDRCQR